MLTVPPTAESMVKLCDPRIVSVTLRLSQRLRAIGGDNLGSMISGRRPTKEEIAAAAGKTLPDVIAPGLDVLFCGINPGLYTVAVGHHFGRPGNRFWPTIYRAGFTPRLFRPDEQRELLRYGCGITNVVARATAAADELSASELVEGARALARKARHFRPRVLAIVGIGAYRTGFARPRAVIGVQPDTLGTTAIWVLPNPSGLNANYRPHELVALYRELHDWLKDPR